MIPMYDSNEATMTRTVLSEHNVDVSQMLEPQQSIADGADGAKSGVVQYKDLEHTKENDGLYSLTARVVDLAGNTSEQTVVYSVNRFGSVYVYSQALTDMIGQYKQAASDDLYIMAYNVTELEDKTAKLQITCDGAMLENQNSQAPEVGQQGASGWYEYRYDLNGADLARDGRYEIVVSDMDKAGNTNTNAEEPIWFYIDSTKPTLDSVVGLEKSVVNASKQQVNYTASDSIALESITVYVNGEAVQSSDEFEKAIYDGSVYIESGFQQNIRFVVKDKAGNVLDTDDETFAPSYTFNRVMTVSTNFFVRWYANKVLFWSSIAVIIAAGGVAAVVFVMRKKKKEAAAVTK